MKRNTRILFEQDPSLDNIEITVRAPERDEETDRLIGQITALSGTEPEKMTVTGEDGSLIRIRTADIVLLSVSGKKVHIVTDRDRYTVRQPLQSLEEGLASKRFVRISRYEIVNLDKVVKFDFTLGGTLRLELAGGMETWASRRNIPLIRKKLAGGD